MAEQKVNPRVVWTVSIILAVLFAAVAVLLLFNPLHSPELNRGAGQARDYATMGLGVVFLLGAVLLLVPRVAWLAALLLAVVLVGYIGLCLVQGELSQTVIPALFVVSLGSLAYIRRPGGAFATAGSKPEPPSTPTTPNVPPSAGGPPV